jgi:hypothetical protein
MRLPRALRALAMTPTLVIASEAKRSNLFVVTNSGYLPDDESPPKILLIHRLYDVIIIL